MAVLSNVTRVTLLLSVVLLSAIGAQDPTAKKALSSAEFSCRLTFGGARWSMVCESQIFVIDSTSKFFVGDLRGNSDPSSPLTYDELLSTASLQDSSLYLCDSAWKFVLEADPSKLSTECSSYKKFLKRFAKVSTETTLREFEIRNSPKIDYVLNILNQTSRLNRIVLKDNLLPTILSIPVCDDNSVTTVILESNGIENISDTLFHKFPLLTKLDLSHNLLTTVQKTLFEGTPSLFELDLSYNEIESVSSDAFSKLELLKIVDLSNNKLKNISEELFRMNTMLAEVDIGNNELVTLPSRLFHNLLNLKNVSCSNCSLVALNKDLFAKSLYVLDLNFSCNFLESLHDDIFKNLQYMQLLDIGYNKISELNKNHFRNKQYLYYVNVTNNEIRTLKSGLFAEAPHLKFLDMTRNKIEKLTDDFVSNFTDLEQFYLSHNRINSIELGLKSNYVFIRNLHISHNIITDLKVGWKQLVFMEKFHADYNLLTSVDLPPCIYSVKQTLTFSFRYNNISRINAEDLIADEIRASSDLHMQSMCYFNGHEKNYVDLSHNPLLCDCKLYPFYKYLKESRPRTFAPFPNNPHRKLEMFLNEEDMTCAGPKHVRNHTLLSLSDDVLSCPTSELCPDPCFCGVRGKDGVVFVNCSSNNLTDVPQMFPNSTKALYFNDNNLESMVSFNSNVWENVSELHLDDNLLETLEEWYIPESLQYLSVRGNKLKSLPPSLMHFIANRSDFRLFLGGNDENCDCDRKTLKRFLMENKQSIKDIGSIICAINNNGSSSYLPLISIPDSDLCPLNVFASSYDQRTLVISLCTFFTFLILLLLVYYKQRQIILSFLYVHFDIIFQLFYTEEDCDEDHVFDAFVAYNGNENDIAMKLMEELEAKPPFFQLCIHERDFLPGRFITENIVNSIQKSRRTIVILSSAFTASPWFNLELRVAVSKMSKDRISRIIVILAEKSVSLDSVDSELRHVISKRTYLIWGERWFWQKLRYAMPRKKSVKVADGNIWLRRTTSEMALVPETV